MNQKYFTRLSLFMSSLMILFSCPQSTQASVILDSGLDGSTTFSNAGNQSGKAVGFTMGSTAYELDNIQVKVAGYNNLAAFRDQSYFALYTSVDAGGGNQKPGTKLIDLTWETTPTSTALNVYTLTPGAVQQLEADTTYWFAMYNDGGDAGERDLRWAYNNSSPLSSSFGVTGTTPAALFAVNSATWNDPNTYSSTSSTFNDMVVNASIPEPSTLVMMLIAGGAGILGLRRYSKPEA